MPTTQAVDALLDSHEDRGRAMMRVRDLIARHPGEVAADPLIVLHALDGCDPRAVGWCPAGCDGGCTA